MEKNYTDTKEYWIFAIVLVAIIAIASILF